MFRLNKMFIALLIFRESLAIMFNTPDHIKCISLNKQRCLTHPNLISFYRNECIETICYYRFAAYVEVLEFVILLIVYLARSTQNRRIKFVLIR